MDVTITMDDGDWLSIMTALQDAYFKNHSKYPYTANRFWEYYETIDKRVKEYLEEEKKNSNTNTLPNPNSQEGRY